MNAKPPLPHHIGSALLALRDQNRRIISILEALGEKATTEHEVQQILSGPIAAAAIHIAMLHLRCLFHQLQRVVGVRVNEELATRHQEVDEQTLEGFIDDVIGALTQSKTRVRLRREPAAELADELVGRAALGKHLGGSPLSQREERRLSQQLTRLRVFRASGRQVRFLTQAHRIRTRAPSAAVRAR